MVVLGCTKIKRKKKMCNSLPNLLKLLKIGVIVKRMSCQIYLIIFHELRLPLKLTSRGSARMHITCFHNSIIDFFVLLLALRDPFMELPCVRNEGLVLSCHFQERQLYYHPITMNFFRYDHETGATEIVSTAEYPPEGTKPKVSSRKNIFRLDCENRFCSIY